MPRGDGTGPMGMGPMTGRGAGYCTGYAAPGFANGGFGMGRGRGFRRMYHMTGQPGFIRYGYPAGAGTYDTVDEKQVLENEAAYLKKQLAQVRERLDGLDKG
ncbi:MAG: DUF5320 domain-containing protein [Eubacteriales bacterium]|nr:DUF5320 domain-containing protein [Eubacteriales bacterium]